MKILEINKFYYRKGGADKHFLDAVELLEKAGHEVAVFSMHNRNNGETYWKKYFLSEVGYTAEHSFWQKIKGIGRMFYSFEAKRKINKLLDEFQPEVVHIHNIYHQLSPCILFEIKRRGIPVIMTVHDFKLINPNHTLFLNGRPYSRCRKGRYFECVADRCVKSSYFKSLLAALEMYWHGKLGTYGKNIDRYIAPSRFVKRILVENGISAQKITVISHFIPEAEKVKKSGFQPVGPFALYSGRISKEKGTDILVRIFRNLKGIKLLLAGSIESGFEIPESENIEYLGYLSQKELREKILQSQLVVSGSKLPETFGLVALEAIAEGKPFLGFCAGAYGEIIRNGENGWLVETEKEFEQKIIEIANREVVFNPELIKKRAKDDFGSEKYKMRLEGIFESFLLTK